LCQKLKEMAKHKKIVREIVLCSFIFLPEVIPFSVVYQNTDAQYCVSTLTGGVYVVVDWCALAVLLYIDEIPDFIENDFIEE